MISHTTIIDVPPQADAAPCTPKPGEPGSESWPANSDAWKYGGGPTWRSGSYDPQLDLVYWGTGNAEPYDPRPREGRDSLYTSSVLAIRPLAHFGCLSGPSRDEWFRRERTIER
jgi:glucose dehydrogenase